MNSVSSVIRGMLFSEQSGRWFSFLTAITPRYVQFNIFKGIHPRDSSPVLAQSPIMEVVRDGRLILIERRAINVHVLGVLPSRSSVT